MAQSSLADFLQAHFAISRAAEVEDLYKRSISLRERGDNSDSVSTLTAVGKLARVYFARSRTTNIWLLAEPSTFTATCLTCKSPRVSKGDMLELSVSPLLTRGLLHRVADVLVVAEWPSLKPIRGFRPEIQKNSKKV